MKKRILITMPVLALLMLVLASCQRTIGGPAEGNYLFDGNWTLVRIGSAEMPQADTQDQLRIKHNRLWEEGMETGSIEKVDGQYVMTEKKSGRQYPCDMKVLLREGLVIYTLTFRTPADDPDFKGDDVVYKRSELQ
jgi:hypothetical protein